MRYGVIALSCLLAACGNDGYVSLSPSGASEAALGAYSATSIPSHHEASLCLGTASASRGPGTLVVLAECGSPQALSWALNNGSLMTDGALCLDVVDGADVPGTRLQLWSCGGSNANQKFVINGQALTWSGRGKCMDVVDGRFEAGTAVQLWSCDGSNVNQQWQLGQ